jgi:hypothetical protein
VADTQDNFANHAQRALVEQVITAQYGTGKCVLQRGKYEVGATLVNCAEERLEGRAGNGVYGFAEQFASGNLAERSGLPLKSNACCAIYLVH